MNAQTEEELHEAERIEAKAAMYNPQQFILPALDGISPPVGYNWEDSSYVTSPWSRDREEMNATNGKKTKKGHNGMDFDGEIGDRINSVMDGIVSDCGEDSGGYGKYIIVSHKNGTKTLYGHLSKINVKKNQTVIAGMKIGEMGNTGKVVSSGNGDGSHLHFGYDGDKDGRFRSSTIADDPARLLFGD